VMTAADVSAAELRPGLDAASIREAFAHYPSGLAALIAMVGTETVGLVASSFTVGVSADPPLVSVAIQRTSTSWPRLRTATTIGISAFGTGQGDLARQLADPRRADRFEGTGLVGDGSAARFVDGASCWFECVVHDEVDAGDHTVAFLEVIAVHVDHDRQPLIFHGSTFREMATAQA